MTDIYYFSLKDFLANNTLDDDARWFLELEATLEFNPIREYKNVVIEDQYEHNVSLDLETRVQTLLDMIEANKKSKRHDDRYLKTLANRLVVRCREQDRPELENKLINILSLL